jgi:cytochrome b561
MASPAGYSRTQIALHWVVFALIAAQFLLHEPISRAWEALKAGGAVAFNPLVALHVFGGGVILAFTLWRLALRAIHGAPAPAPGKTPAQLRVQALVLVALYGLMILMPVSGALAWFGGVEAAALGHAVAKIALLALVALHVAATLVEQFVKRTDPMSRMRRPAA